MQTEARLTRSRARQTETPLTAPLPYTTSKGSKPASDRDADLPRAVLFDMTNDKARSPVHEPAADDTSEQATDKLTEPAPAASDSPAEKPTPLPKSGVPASAVSEGPEISVIQSEAADNPLPNEGKAAEQIKPLTAEDLPIDIGRSGSTLSKVAVWGSPSTVASAFTASPGDAVKTGGLREAEGTDTNQTYGTSHGRASQDTPHPAKGPVNVTPRPQPAEALNQTPLQQSFFAPPASTYQMQHPDWTMRKPLRPYQTPKGANDASKGEGSVPAADIPRVSSVVKGQPTTREPLTTALVEDESVPVPFGSPHMPLEEEELKAADIAKDPLIGLQPQHSGVKVETLPTANKKKEAAIALLDANHQDAMDDRWQMDGASSPKALPSHVDGAPRLQSRVVRPEDFDPRSLRQLRKAIKARVKAEERDTASCTSSEVIITQDPNAEEDEVVSKLTAAIGGMGIADCNASPEPLKGVPVREGKHIRFNDDDQPFEVKQRVQLRGVPQATGQHIHFD